MNYPSKTQKECVAWLGRAALSEFASVQAIVTVDGKVFRGTLVKMDPRAVEQVEFPAMAALYGGPLAVKFTKKDSVDEKLVSTAPRFVAHIALQCPSGIAPLPGELCSLLLDDQVESVFKLMVRFMDRWLNHLAPDASS